MKAQKKILAALSLSLTLSCTAIAPIISDATVVEAHSGRTDSSGGHHDNKNASGLGSYHYHCGGYPAHLHTGGVCPYSSSASLDTSTAVQTANSGGGSLSVNAINNSSYASESSSSNSENTITEDIVLYSGQSIDISADIAKLIQDVLNQKGYDCGSVDGVLGEKSQNAIKKFLEDNSGSSSTDYMIIAMVAEGLGIQ